MRMTQSAQLRADWGSKVRQAREQRGWTVVQLAQRAGVDPGNLSRLERGLQGASDIMRIRLAAALEAKVADLFAYPDAQPESEQAAS